MKKSSALSLIKYLLLLFTGISIFSSVFAQQTDKVYKLNSETPAAAHLKMISPNNNLEISKPGTYQIVRVVRMTEEVVPQSLIDQIESYRSQDQVIYLKAGENTSIKILPYSEILAEDFKPVEPVIYIDRTLDK